MAAEHEDLSWEGRLERCQQALGYRFEDLELLRRCLTHASSAPTRLESNERLEFFGDSVLGVVVCEYLFRQYPRQSEGELTRIKSSVVSRVTCAEVSVELGLDSCLRLGKGLGHGRAVPMSILAGVFESLIAGLFLDGGLDVAREVVERCLAERMSELAVAETRNYKHLLQQLAQKRYGETPVYQLLDEQGPDHSKCFQVAAAISDEAFPAAWGPNKKEAEQAAARNALSALGAPPAGEED